MQEFLKKSNDSVSSLATSNDESTKTETIEAITNLFNESTAYSMIGLLSAIYFGYLAMILKGMTGKNNQWI